MTRVVGVAVVGALLGCSGIVPPNAVPEPAPIEPAAPAAPAPAEEAKVAVPTLDEPATWARMDSVAFGCLLERAGQPVDAAYECGAPTPDPGDPCTDVDAYGAGPKLPEAVAAKFGPEITGLAIEWEHGDLRMITVDGAPGTTEEQLLAKLHLKAADPGVSVQDCTKDHKCVVWQFFDHMGAGDVDCDDSSAPTVNDLRAAADVKSLAPCPKASIEFLRLEPAVATLPPADGERTLIGEKLRAAGFVASGGPSVSKDGDRSVAETWTGDCECFVHRTYSPHEVLPDGTRNFAVSEFLSCNPRAAEPAPASAEPATPAPYATPHG